MAAGIDVRHTRVCNSKGGGACDCKPTYQAHVWDAKAGKRIRKTFPTPSAAKRWRQDSVVALGRGELSADRGPRFSEAIDAWLDGLRAGYITTRSGAPYKPAAIRDYERNLRLRAVPVLGDKRLGDITTQDVQRLIDDLVSKGLASATIDAALTPLKALYRRAVGRGEVHMNPTTGIEKPAVRTKTKRVVAHKDAEAMRPAPLRHRPRGRRDSCPPWMGHGRGRNRAQERQAAHGAHRRGSARLPGRAPADLRGR